ncbi:MAG: DUF4238 domain-containing protein [Phycisphaerales bacterium]|nr:DUF4238 domain-containing protein [Phycisphaerales bacterium]
MSRPSRRQHYIARFYLRNFSEPPLSDSLCVYDLRKRRWERRTPLGVGWFPHLCSETQMDGTRSDAFDQFLKLKVEDPAAPALRKLASGACLDASERAAISMFIALTAARSPRQIAAVVDRHLAKLTNADRVELDASVRLWCECTGTRLDSKAYGEFLKPSSFGAIWAWSINLHMRLLQWEWRLVHTTRESPFITSDRPVLAQWDKRQDVRLVTFPISSEVALVIFSGGQFNEGRCRSIETRSMNCGTMERATDFVVSCNQTFPGADLLASQRVS